MDSTRSPRKYRVLLTLAALGLVIGVFGGFASGAIPNSNNGKIYACYKKANPNKGDLRLIDNQTSQHCNAGELPVSFYSSAGADTAFLGATATAADSDTLDGIDSSGFVQGAGARTFFQLLPSNTITTRNTPAGQLNVACQTNGTYFAQYNNTSGATISLWLDDSIAGLSQLYIPDGNGALFLPGVPGTRHLVLRASNGTATAHFDMYLVGDGVSDCTISVEEEVS